MHRRKLKSRAMLSHNDRISLGGRVFIFESCPDSETKKVECNKYDFAQQGRISLLKKNGASATTVRIHREVTIGRYDCYYYIFSFIKKVCAAIQ